MSKRLYGSLDLTRLIEKAKEGHSAFRKAESNGHIYVNINQWINDEKDAKGNDSSITLNSSKEKKEEEGKVYIGNLKISEAKSGDAPVGETDVPNLDDLPF